MSRWASRPEFGLEPESGGNPTETENYCRQPNELCPASHNDALSFQGSKVIHRSSLTMESEVSLNFTTGRWKARFALLSTDEIEDFLLACSELGHRCSTEHYQLSKSRKHNLPTLRLFGC